MHLSYTVGPCLLARYAAVDFSRFEEPRPVGYAELSGRYRRLRHELDAAYAVPVWNSSRIDQITEQMLEVERALAAVERDAPRGMPPEWHGAAAGDAAGA